MPYWTANHIYTSLQRQTLYISKKFDDRQYQRTNCDKQKKDDILSLRNEIDISVNSVAEAVVIEIVSRCFSSSQDCLSSRKDALRGVASSFA